MAERSGLLRGVSSTASGVGERHRRLRPARTHHWQQFKSLLLKNVLVQRRNKRLVALYVLLPALAVALIALMKATAYSVAGGAGKPAPLAFGRCASFDVYGQVTGRGAGSGGGGGGGGCVTVAFAPDGSGPGGGVVREAAMRQLAAGAGLAWGRDVVGFRSASEIARHMRRSAGSIDAAVVFPDPARRPLRYEIWYNKSAAVDYRRNGMNPLLALYGVEGRAAALQAAVDAALISATLNSTTGGGGGGGSGGGGVSVSIAPSAISFPQKITVAERERAGRVPPVIDLFASGLMAGGWALASGLVLLQAVGERRQKLLGVMRLMGLSEAAHWGSWLAFWTAPTLLAALLAVLTGRRCGLRLFTLSDFRLLFALHAAFGLTMACLALASAAVIGSAARRANSHAFLVVALAGASVAINSTFVRPLATRYLQGLSRGSTYLLTHSLTRSLTHSLTHSSSTCLLTRWRATRRTDARPSTCSTTSPRPPRPSSRAR